MEEQKSSLPVKTETPVIAQKFSGGYFGAYAGIVKMIVVAALVITIVIFVFIIYRKIKAALVVNRDDVTKLDFAQKDYYKQYYMNNVADPKKYSEKQKAQFLRNYDYPDTFFQAIQKDLSELQNKTIQAFWNPVQGVKNIAGLFSTSGFRQCYGVNTIREMKNIKSKIMLSMMAERYYVLTGNLLIDDMNFSFDEQTMQEFYKYIIKLPESVK